MRKPLAVQKAKITKVPDKIEKYQVKHKYWILVPKGEGGKGCPANLQPSPFNPPFK